MLFLDQNRLKKLNQNNVIIDSFAPDLFSKKDLGNHEEPISWIFESDFERQCSSISKNSKTTKSTHSLENPMVKMRTLNMPKDKDHKKIELRC